jgi:hypothetical protein
MIPAAWMVPGQEPMLNRVVLQADLKPLELNKHHQP